MVSTYQQYLCPDFTNNLPSTVVDSNTSHLALLAQTCNNIGLPDQQHHTSNGTGGKLKQSNHQDNNSSSSSNNNCNNNSNSVKSDKHSSKNEPNQSKSNFGNSTNNSNNNVKPSTSSSSVPSISANDSNDGSGKDKIQPEKKPGSPIDDSRPSNNVILVKEEPQLKCPSDKTNGISGSETSSESSINEDSGKMSSSAASTSSAAGPGGSNSCPTGPVAGPISSVKCPTMPTGSGISSTLSYPPPHLFQPYFSAAASTPGFFYPHGALGSSPPFSYYPGLLPTVGNPPAAYPRMCLDPYCKSCPTAHNLPALQPSSFSAAAALAASRPCPLGCLQCTTHPDLSAWFNAYAFANGAGGNIHGQTPTGFVGLNGGPLASSGASSLAAGFNPLATHFSQNAAIVGSNSASQPAAPPVCWWDSGDGFCLKRFASTEEFFQHLRTHALESAAAGKPPPSGALTSGPASLTLSASHVPPATLGAPNAGGGRLSPRSTNYLNALNSYRYHPYNKLGVVPDGLSTVHHVPFTSLNPAAAAAYNLQSVLFPGQRFPGSLPHP